MNPIPRRIVASGLAWTVGAAASVAVSILALSSIDAGSAAGPARQLSPDGLTWAAPTTPGGSPSPAADGSDPASPARPPRSAADGPAGSAPRLLSTRGGTVVASCPNGSAYLVSWSPAQGYHAGEVRRGPAAEVGLLFLGPAHRIEVAVHCVAGTPTLDDDAWQTGHGDY